MDCFWFGMVINIEWKKIGIWKIWENWNMEYEKIVFHFDLLHTLFVGKKSYI